ncbi:MAG: FAD-dependent oxidoreductase [Myxococcota bacterium]|nr:FAD-dependent oxidoreductase [Myxococcota bacterium]
MRCLIIGGDAAGMTAASQIRRRHSDWEVVVLEKGLVTSYAACGIPYFIAGDVSKIDDLVIVTPEEFREKRGIDVKIGWEATGLDPAKRSVIARDGNSEHTLTYDRLLLATGAEPIVPAWPGIDLEGVVSIRNLKDAERVMTLVQKSAKRAVIVGAGYVGLEMAEAFSRRGLEVTVVEKQDGVMGGIEQRITELVENELSEHDASLKLSTTVQGFEGTGDLLKSVVTDKGRIDADIAIVSLGVQPNSELARNAGIDIGETGAIRVDDHQRTSADDVYAAGDCAESWHRVLARPVYVPLALGANRQGRIAGVNMADGDERFSGIVGSAITRVFGLAVGRTGIDERTAERAGIPIRAIEATAPSRAHYMPDHGEVWVKLLFRTDNECVVGAMLAGRDTCLGKRCDIVATAITAGMTVSDMAALDLSYAPPFSPVWDPVLQAAGKAHFALADDKSGN